VRLVIPALLAYAHYLEDELRLPESLDVLETTLRVGGAALASGDRIATRLRLARVLRKLNLFDAAELTYDAAGTLAAASGDRHSELLSRIGRANTLLGRGNLAEAEDLLYRVLTEATAFHDSDSAARAHQVMAVVLSARGQPAEAIPHLWLAYERYADDPSRMRALGDLGAMLLMVGDARGAELALNVVMRHGGPQDMVSNATIELMHCASYRRDRIGFERWRAQCEQRRDSMPPNILVDFFFKSGIGRARFGQFDNAEAALNRALAIAQDIGLHEFTFRIERIKSGLCDCREHCDSPLAAAAELPFESEAVREVSHALASLEA
jgi:tetratricopeptide (TPR) repeat protein